MAATLWLILTRFNSLLLIDVTSIIQKIFIGSLKGSEVFYFEYEPLIKASLRYDFGFGESFFSLPIHFDK